jgi:hypothetical protein
MVSALQPPPTAQMNGPERRVHNPVQEASNLGLPELPNGSSESEILASLGFTAVVIDTLQNKSYVKDSPKLSDFFNQQVTFTDSRLLQY